MSKNVELIQQLKDMLQKLPPDVLDASGRFLYSSGETMKAGRYYLIGLNPGGSPDDYQSLRKEMANWEKCTKNAFLDEAWKNKNGCYPKGESPHQKRVRELCRIFGVEVRDVCASNWILARSPNAEALYNKNYLATIFITYTQNHHGNCPT